MRRHHEAASWVAMLALATADQAHAHSAAGALLPPSPFLAGVSHPVLGADHFLAMFAVGVLSSILGGRHLWLIPLAFVAAMPLGWVAGRAGLVVPALELGIALSVLALGTAGVFARSVPKAAIYAGVAMFALLHGNAHGVETPQGAAPLLYAGGFLVGTAALHLLGLFIGDILQEPRGRSLPVTFLSAGIALAGLWFLAGQLGPFRST